MLRFPLRPSGGRGRGPSRQRWEGEVGIDKRSGILHLTPALSAPGDGEGDEREPQMGVRPPLFFTLLIATLISIIALVPTADANAAGAVVVASKIDTEGALLGNMIAEVIAARGMAVERRIQLGPTNIVRAAILAGQIDLYPESTGNGAIFFHRESDPVWKNAVQGYAEV